MMLQEGTDSNVSIKPQQKVQEGGKEADGQSCRWSNEQL